MKKLILFLALGLAVSAHAQLTVLENGMTIIGNSTDNDTDNDHISLRICDLEQDKTNSLFPRYIPTVAFGEGTGAMISGTGTLGSLNLTATSSFNLYLGRNAQCTFRWRYSDNAFVSFCDMKAPSFLTTSDARLKKNVSSLSDSFGRLMDVNAVSYNLAASSSAKVSEEATKNSAANPAVVDDRTHFGFIAQEIQKIYPNLVVEDEDGMLP